jgi:two-component sensor histidine kinase
MSSARIIPIHPYARIDFALVDEVNHRVANHLALIANLVQVQAGRIAKGPAQVSREEVQRILRETAAKIVAVGQLHRKLAGMAPGEAIDLGDYLIESSHAFLKSMALTERVGIVHRLDARCPAKAEQVQPVALIVGEIIMNAIKHAHPTGIPVEISIFCGRGPDERLTVEVSDDGVGFPEGFDVRNGGGTGLRLIRQLAATIQAELDIESDSLGARFHLTLPVTA